MRALTYFMLKNNFVEEELGVKLIPDSQLRDIPVTNDMIENMNKYIKNISSEDYSGTGLDIQNCLYCAVYRTREGHFCEECPMSLEGNDCLLLDSTYNKCLKAMKEKNFNSTQLKKRLLLLGKDFLESNHLRRGNQTLLSKELLAKAVKKDVYRIIPDSSSDEKEAPGDDINFEANEEYGVAYCCSKDEVAAKVKRWVCMSSVYFMSSCIKRDGCYAYIELETEPFKPQKIFEAKTEYEAIFKAGEWLMEEMEYKERQKEKES